MAIMQNDSFSNTVSMKRDNLYILTLQKGADHIDDGITYNVMISYLVDIHGIIIKEENKIAFQTWFYKKFFEPKIDAQLKYYSTRADLLTGNTYDPASDRKSFLRGEAYMELIDYLELKEARKSSSDANNNALKANRMAIIAMIISGILAITSISISLLEYFENNETDFNSIHYRSQLLQNDKDTLIEACYFLGENYDDKSIPLLFENIYDPRITNDVRYNGLSVYQARMIAINRILGLNYAKNINYKPDSALVDEFYRIATKLDMIE